MPSGGNATGRGLESADAAKVSRGADGTAAVAADSAHRATGGDCGGFASAGATCRIRRVPWVGSFAAHAVVCFVAHQEFGRIGVAEQDCAGIFETIDKSRVGNGNVILAEERARGAGPTGYVEAGFYGKGNSFKRAWLVSARDSGFGVARTGTGGFGVNVHEGIELGLDLLDAIEVGGDEFDGRNFLATEFCESFSDCGINGLGHGGRKKGNGPIAIGQGELEKWPESRYKIG